MKYRPAYDRERDLILGLVEGDVDPDLVRAMSAELAESVKSSGCRKVLNDLRSAHITDSAFNIYSLPRIVKEQGVPIKCKRALVVSEETWHSRFLETVSVNIGRQIRIFKDMDRAVEWLQT